MDPRDIGIAISAIASLAGAGLGLFRYLEDRQHVRLEIKTWDRLVDEPIDQIRIRVSIFVRSRPTWIDSANICIGKEEVSIGRKNVPALLERKSLRLYTSLDALFTELDQQEAITELSPDYKVDDIPKLHAVVVCGEGHRHLAKMDRASRKHFDEFMTERRKNLKEAQARNAAAAGDEDELATH